MALFGGFVLVGGGGLSMYFYGLLPLSPWLFCELAERKSTRESLVHQQTQRMLLNTRLKQSARTVAILGMLKNKGVG